MRTFLRIGLLAVLTLVVGISVTPAAQADPLDCFTNPSACVGVVTGVAGSVAGSAVSVAGTSVLSSVAEEFAEAAASVLRETFGWWLRTPTVSIADSGVLRLQGVILGLAAVVGMIALIIQAIRMMVTRKGTPLAEVVQGSLVAAAITAAGVALVDAALIAGDTLAQSILRVGFASSDELVERMVLVLFGTGVTGTSGLLLLFAVIVILVGLVQAVLFFLRQAAIPLLALIFPIVAVGQLGPMSTRQWLPKVAATVMAIVLYKPLVALILSAGFVQLAEGATLVDVVRGFVTLALSVIALPAMLKLFTPIAGAVASGGGQLGAMAGAAASVGAMTAMRGHGTAGDITAAQQAAHMSGSSGPGSPGPAGGPGGVGPTAPQPSPAPASGGTSAVQAAARGSAAASGAAAPAAASTPVGSAATVGAAGATGIGVPVAVAVKAGEVGAEKGRVAGDQVSGGDRT